MPIKLSFWRFTGSPTCDCGICLAKSRVTTSGSDAAPGIAGTLAVRDVSDATCVSRGAGGAGGAGELEASPWCAYKDPATGMTFYHNATSGASQWERPEGFAEPDRNDADGGAGEVDARDLHEVHSVDDLGI